MNDYAFLFGRLNPGTGHGAQLIFETARWLRLRILDGKGRPFSLPVLHKGNDPDLRTLDLFGDNDLRLTFSGDLVKAYLNGRIKLEAMTRVPEEGQGALRAAGGRGAPARWGTARVLPNPEVDRDFLRRVDLSRDREPRLGSNPVAVTLQNTDGRARGGGLGAGEGG